MNEIDDSNLAICCSCGYVDDWVEIPGGQCSVSGEGLDYCPECGEVDNMADYTVERAARVYKRLFDKQMMPHPSLESLTIRGSHD
jgi:hypothetical protein